MQFVDGVAPLRVDGDSGQQFIGMRSRGVSGESRCFQSRNRNNGLRSVLPEMSHPLSAFGGTARCTWQSIRDFIVRLDNHSSELPPHLGCARFARHVLRRMEAQPFHGDPFQGPEIQLAGSQDRERLDLETMAVRGEKEVRETGGGRFCQDLWNPLFR